jgi:hypothetical protein
MFGRWISRIIAVVCFCTIGHGILLWAASKGIHPEQWVAAMIDRAASTEITEAAWYLIVGVFALAATTAWSGLRVDEKLLGWFKKTPGQAEPQNDPYGYALAFDKPILSWDKNNLINTLEARLEFRNTSPGPLQFSVERFEAIFGERVVATGHKSATIPLHGRMTIFPDGGIDRKTFNKLGARFSVLIEYSIVYGHPLHAASWRTSKKIRVDNFKKSNRIDYNWVIVQESDSHVAPG